MLAVITLAVITLAVKRMKFRFAVCLLVLAAFALALWRGLKLLPPRGANALFYASITQGADVPMRAEMTLTWRRHGITHMAQARVVQGARGRRRIEYTLPVEARGRAVYSDGQTQWQREPGRDRLAATSLLPESEQDERVTADLVARNYKIVQVSDDERVAGRGASLLELLPRQAGRSSQKRWIDRQTYKILRIETHYADGILARMVAYTPTALPATVAPDEFAPPASDALRRVSGPATSRIVSGNALAASDPAAAVRGLGLRAEGAQGFRLIQVASSAVEQAQTAHLLYSDGIESVSVFVQNGGASIPERSPGWHDLTLNGRTAYESRDGHLDAIVWTQQGRRYTAVSHLEPHTLQSFVADQMAAR